MKLGTIFTVLFFVLAVQSYSQDNTTTTPEYEATRQTEKIQQELNLSAEQVKLIYEINLKYARARQNSTSRSEAMQRIKNKDADLERVLNADQINKLRTKRYERSVYQPAQSDNFRSSEPVQRINAPVRRSTTEMQTRETQQRRTDEGQHGIQRRVQTPFNSSGQSRTTDNEHSMQSSGHTPQMTLPRRDVETQPTQPIQRREQPTQNKPTPTETRRR
jgi:hypothetical protein